MAIQTVKRCSYCQGFVPTSYDKCPHCDRYFESPNKKDKKDFNLCKTCGTYFNKNLFVCPNCKNKIS